MSINNAVNTIIKAMHLTSAEYETLKANMFGMSNIEIAKLLNVNRTTIWRRISSVIRKYNSVNL